VVRVLVSALGVFFSFLRSKGFTVVDTQALPHTIEDDSQEIDERGSTSVYASLEEEENLHQANSGGSCTSREIFPTSRL